MNLEVLIPAEVRKSVLDMLFVHLKSVQQVARHHRLKHREVQAIQWSGFRRMLARAEQLAFLRGVMSVQGPPPAGALRRAA